MRVIISNFSMNIHKINVHDVLP